MINWEFSLVTLKKSLTFYEVIEKQQFQSGIELENKSYKSVEHMPGSENEMQPTSLASMDSVCVIIFVCMEVCVI